MKKIFDSTPFFKLYQDYYFNYENRFHSAYSIDNLPRIEDGVHITNLNDKRGKGTFWVLYLLTEIQLRMLTFLGCNIFHKKY